LNTAISLALAAASTRTDPDGPGGTSPGARAAGGVNGFKLVGMSLGVLVHSRAFGYTMGVYGAGMSLYSNFLARGHEVVFPKNTAMEVALTRRSESASSMGKPETAAHIETRLAQQPRPSQTSHSSCISAKCHCLLVIEDIACACARGIWELQIRGH
jgi:hypothetical protein